MMILSPMGLLARDATDVPERTKSREYFSECALQARPSTTRRPVLHAGEVGGPLWPRSLLQPADVLVLLLDLAHHHGRDPRAP